MFNLSYASRLKALSLHTLEYRPLQQDLIYVYTISTYLSQYTCKMSVSARLTKLASTLLADVIMHYCTMPKTSCNNTCTCYVCYRWYWDFSLPGQFVPRSELAKGPWPIRSLELSLPGTFAPWPFRYLAFSLPGQFIPWPFRSQAFSLPGIPWNYRSLNVSIAVYFRCRTLAFTPKIKYKIVLQKIN